MYNKVIQVSGKLMKITIINSLEYGIHAIHACIMACGNIPILDSVLMYIVAYIRPCVSRNIIPYSHVCVYRGAHPALHISVTESYRSENFPLCVCHESVTCSYYFSIPFTKKRDNITCTDCTYLK